MRSGGVRSNKIAGVLGETVVISDTVWQIIGACSGVAILTAITIFRVGKYSNRISQLEEDMEKHVEVNHKDYSEDINHIRDKMEEVLGAVEGVKGYLGLGAYRTTSKGKRVITLPPNGEEGSEDGK